MESFFEFAVQHGIEKWFLVIAIWAIAAHVLMGVTWIFLVVYRLLSKLEKNAK